MSEDDTIGQVIQRDLDRLPLLPADRWIPPAPGKRTGFKLSSLLAMAGVLLLLVVAVGVGQGIRALREGPAANLAPDSVSSSGAGAFVPPHLASPDSIAVLYDTRPSLSRGPNQAPVASVAVIDAQTGAVRYSVPVADQVRAVFRPAGAELIVIDWPTDTAQRIQFVDALTGAITGTITEPRPRPALGAWPELGAAVSPDGKVLALQQLGTPITNPAVGADGVAFYDLETRKADAVLFTPNCGPGQLGFTDDGRSLFLVCSSGPQFFVIDGGTRKAVTSGGIPPQGPRFAPRAAALGGMTVIGSSATVVTRDGQDRFVIRADGTINGMNLGQLFSDADAVPAGAVVRVPRQGRVFVGYGPAVQATVLEVRIMDEGSSGGRISITRESVGGLLADDRGNLFGAAADGSIWRRGPTSVSDDVTLMSGMPGRTARLLGTLRASPPTLLTRDQAIKVMSAPNIRVERADRVEAKLVTLREALGQSATPVGYLDGVDRATPVWVVALRGEMHVIRGLIDIDANSALFVLDAQIGQPIAFFSTRLDWPNGFDSLIDLASSAAGPTASPRLPLIGGVAPIGDIAARVACDGKLGSARLVAAFDSTAGVVADWVENVSYPDAPRVASSAWRALPPSAPAYVCYFDGQFAPPGGPVGTSVPHLVGRALILFGSNGVQLGPSKYGPVDSLPLARPGGRF